MLELDISPEGVATLTLNRPEVHNAFNSELVNALIIQLDALTENPKIRALLLTSSGKHFSSGADLNWMQEMASHTPFQNHKEAQTLAELLHKLDVFPHPTIVAINGAAFGGAIGLICCCDIAIASPDSKFCLSEVKLGLIPATIGPYVIRAMGVRQSRRYFLTAEIIKSQHAVQLNLIHEINEAPIQAAKDLMHNLLFNGPNALAEAKKVIALCEQHPLDKELRRITSQMIAEIRVSKEGQEGVQAFFDNRSPSWHDTLQDN